MQLSLIVAGGVQGCCGAQALGTRASAVAACGPRSAGPRSFLVAYVHAHVLTRPLFIGWRMSPGDQDRHIPRLLQEAQDQVVLPSSPNPQFQAFGLCDPPRLS